MKLHSKYFDSIRVKPDEDRLLRDQHPECDWRGCSKPGLHPAPKGRGHEREYFNFCLDHVRQYNKSYNYFDGMSDDDVADYQKASVTGHRPTWSMGTKGANGSAEQADSSGPNRFGEGFSMEDPFGFFGRSTVDDGPRPVGRERPVRRLERRYLNALGLGESASREEIKARFKALVKRHHPDANGGDTRSEDRLREVIQAYNYLKQAGLC